MLCGLEIHQRLCGRKLFNACSTPSADEQLSKDSIKIIRHLVSSKSELGKTDATSKFEQSKNLQFEYISPCNYSCLVDTDEEPPGQISTPALLSAISLAKSANSYIVDELQIMRKLVLDGSNTSGFQRTALVALGGAIKHPDGEIALESICIEEESAGIVEKNSNSSTYRLDRLGIPLLEITTKPIFKSADQASKGAQIIGEHLRLLDNAMRGLGTIRQDVNISVEGGNRVEIKGLQDLKMFSTLIKNEVARQKKIIEINAKLKSRGFNPNDLITPVDITNLFSNCECKIIKNEIDLGGVVLGAKLPKYAGLVGEELYTDRRFGTELSDYAKIAGGVKGLIHSDEDMKKYKISNDLFEKICSQLKMQKEDAFILIASSEQSASRAIQSAIKRACTLEVVKETRKANEDGSSSFMRPMAGMHRMYPETDLRSILTQPLVKSAKTLETLTQRKSRLCSLIGAQMAERMALSHNYVRFAQLVNAGADATLIANILEQTFVALKRAGVDVQKISDDFLLELSNLFTSDKITKASIEHIIKIGAGENKTAGEIVQAHNLFRLSKSQIQTAFEDEGFDVRKFMQKYRLIVDGKDILQLQKHD